MIIAVPSLIWVLISGTASIFGILGITVFDGRSIGGPAPEWFLRGPLPNIAPAEGLNSKVQGQISRPARSSEAPAKDSEPSVSLGMQPTTYATLPRASTDAVVPPVRPAPSPFPDASSGASATYMFNNKEVALQVVGDLVQVRYLDVRKEMADNGVKVGDLFAEFRIGSSLSGTARLRSKRCGVAPYDVTGTSEENYRIIRLHGDARKFEETCRQTSEVYPMSIVLVRK